MLKVKYFLQIVNWNLRTTRKTFVKKVFDVSTYNPESFKQSAIMGNWADFYAQNCAEGMFTSFVRDIEKNLTTTSVRQKIIRNEKCSLLGHKK